MAPGVDFEQLRTFQAIYRTGTLTGAATVLGVSQPTVTARLQALENASGTHLFDRGPTGCRPTAAADRLAERLREPVQQLAQVAASLRHPQDLTHVHVRLGVPAEYFEHVLAARLAPLVSTGMTLGVDTGLALPMLDRLRGGTLDVVVSTVRPGSPFTVATLDDEDFVLVAAPVVAAAVDQTELRDDPAAALASLPRITYDQQQSMFRRWWRHVLHSRPPAGPTITVPDLRGVKALAVAGAGIAVLPSYLCATELESGSLVELVHQEDEPINTLYLATMEHLQHQPQVRAVWRALLGQPTS